MAKLKKSQGVAARLRFPGFAEEWEVTKLGAKSTIVRGGSPRPIDAFLTNAADGLNWLKIGDVDKEAKYIERTQEKVIPAALSKTRQIHPGDLILSNSMSFGRPYISKIVCCIHDGWLAITDIESRIDPDFLYYVLGAEDSQKFFLSTAAGSGVKNLNADGIRQLMLSFPGRLEQQKITDCLSSLDACISAESRKLDALKAYKQSLMQQLFPAEGQLLPQLRFPGFEGEWEEQRLSELGDVLMCKRIFAEETNDVGEVPFFKIGTLGGKPDAFISQQRFENYKAKYSYPKLGEVLITCSGTVGKCLPYDGRDAYFQDSNIVWIDNPLVTITNELLIAILSSVDWGTLNSTTISRIYGADLRGLPIKFPSEKREQKQVTACLSSLNDLISAQSRKISTLQQHKKGLMQGLFPVTSA